MKIAVNVRFLIKNKLEGIGVFTFETLKRIVTTHREHQFFFLFDREYAPEFIFSDNVIPVVVHPQARHPVLWYIWFNFSLPRALKKLNPDIFISTDGFIPLKRTCKTLNVIHDIAFEHYPKDIPGLVNNYYKRYFPLFARNADRIATVSEYSKADLSKTYHLPEDKIDVVYNGSSSIFIPLNDQDRKNVRQHLTSGSEYFAYAGALHSRKNISMLLKSYDLFRSISEKEFKLVVIGRKAWKTDEMMATYESLKYKDDVIFTGHVTDELLAKYLASAYALTYISYFEGFGLPVLEAMYCDVPSITSNVTSLPEVTGKAGMLVDPFNINDIAVAMKQLAENSDLRDRLIKEGRKHRENFSWDITAEKLWQSLLKVL
jgi:glycosyltransferase involved in cell wall biosynthesis